MTNGNSAKIILIFLLIPFFQVYSQANDLILADDQRQDEDLRDVEVFAPFVSRIQTRVTNNRVFITWTDIPDITTVRYRVYRSRRELFPEDLSNAEHIGEVPPGIQQLEDTVDTDGFYYYAVVTVDQSDTEVPVLIPARNKTVLPAIVNLLEGESFCCRCQFTPCRDRGSGY